MKIILILGAVFALAHTASVYDVLKYEWEQFKSTHLKTYDNDFIENHRMNVFIQNKRKIEEHNRKYELGLVSFKLAVNKYADLLSEEFRSMMNGYNRSENARKSGQRITYIEPENVQIPDSFDWRPTGAVTPVKDQRQCGSCWAFSATGSLEGQHFRKTGKLVSLSEQNLVDCSRNYGNMGCFGGLMDQAFEYIRDNQGVDTESSYPYEGVDDLCRFNEANVGATDTGFVDIEEGSEDDLKSAIATVGPISVAIDAGSLSFQFYGGGVYYEPFCSSDRLNHGVLAVGYGSEDGKDYWLVKNSWGSSWGDNGYIKMTRNRDNNCGIATQASYPLV